MKKLAALGFLAATLTAGGLGAATTGDKYYIAHYQGNGTYEEICVSTSAWYSSHQYHEGDYIISSC